MVGEVEHAAQSLGLKQTLELKRRRFYRIVESVASSPGIDVTQRRRDAKKTAEYEGCSAHDEC
jgi:hypothetical protein